MKSSTGKKECPHVSALAPILGTTKDDNCHKLGLHKLYDFCMILLTSAWDFTRQKQNIESGPWVI